LGGTLVAALAGGVVALIFGLTRLALQVHTVADVIVGAAVGVVGAVLLRKLAGDRPATLSSPRLAVAACVVMLLFHGHRLEAETRIRWLALDVWPLSACRQVPYRKTGAGHKSLLVLFFRKEHFYCPCLK
jgi:hypothetical protein